MSNIFDPASFLDVVIETVQERRKPLPAGDYTAVIGEVTCRSWTSDKNGETKSGIVFDLPLLIQVPGDVAASVGYENLTVKDGIMPDITPQGGIDLAPGKSSKLRMYREALDMNKEGEAFRPRAMQGRILTVKIGHEDYQGNVQERVKAVARA